MKREIDRRKFTGLTAAAFGGILAGSMAGCGGDDDGGTEVSRRGDEGDEEGGDDEVAANDWTSDTHVCRGLDACKGKGAGGENECAGLGACATIDPHSCAGQNDCKYQGGCGDKIGNNGCKGKGGCSVPLHEGAWETARESFEAAMKKSEKSFGDAPARPTES